MSEPVPREHAGAPPSKRPAVPEPTLAERARSLVRIARIGTLATNSERRAGFPFGSLMPYTADERGRPVFLISSMAMHTRNLLADPRCCLFVAQPDLGSDPLGAARVSLLGEVQAVSEAERGAVRDLYLSRYENARYWVGFQDFNFFRMELRDIYFIGGFGVMGWIAAEQYQAAEPDPLADAAPDIIAHMNADHAAALALIAGFFGGEEADRAEIISVDRLGFWLRLTKGERIHGLRIAFPHEVRDTRQARTVFVEMVRQARHGSL